MVDLFGEPSSPPPMDSTESENIETTIEIDDIELSPRNNPNLVGHNNVEKELIDRINSNKMPHALILHGPKGIGKATLAFRLSKYLLNESENSGGLFAVDSEPENTDSLAIDADKKAFRQVSAESHPDLFTAEQAEDKNRVSIETIRKIAPYMRMTSNVIDGWRICIVDDADTMTINAQNALLKILEEPPKKALIILVVHRMGVILPTIISRCQSISMSSLTTQECKAVIRQLNIEGADQNQELFIDYSEGSPGVIAGLIEEGGDECVQEMLDILKTYPKFDPKIVHRFSERHGSPRSDKAFNTMGAYLKWIFRVLVKAKIMGSKLPFILSDNSGLQNIYESSTYEELLQYHDDLDDLISTAKHKSLDKRNTILKMFFLLQN